MKKITTLLVALLFAAIGAFAQDVNIFSADNKKGAITPKTIEAAFAKHGFEISDNRDMNTPFTKQFGKSDFAVYNLFTLYRLETVEKLVDAYPQIGMFTPMSMAIYTKTGDSKIHVASLSAAAMAKITGIPADNAELLKLEKAIKEALAEALPGGTFEKSGYEIAKTDKPLVTGVTIEVDPADWEGAKEDFQTLFEGGLETNGFVMASYLDLNFILQDKGNNNFDFYDVDSICKLPVIYTVAKSRPEAGAFAPCALYMYKKKGEGAIHIAYPNVYNWMSSLNVEDKEAIDVLQGAQKLMEQILEESNL